MLHMVIAGKNTSDNGVVVDSIDVWIDVDRNSDVLLIINARPMAWTIPRTMTQYKVSPLLKRVT
jgi:hypothetical protein